MLSFDIQHHTILGSTNDEAKILLQNGAPEGTVVWADAQTQGRGRMGRSWYSVLGNLYFSLILKPEKSLSDICQLSFLAAVSVGDALKTFLPDSEKMRYKWPNDILIDSQKICGILLETETINNQNAGVVIGVGINISQAPEQVIYPTTCLTRMTTKQVTAEMLLPLCLDRLRYWYAIWKNEGFNPVRQMWLKHAFGLDSMITVSQNDQPYQGLFKGINEQGALILKTDQGDLRSFFS